MKINLPCVLCSHESNGEEAVYATVDLNDVGFYKFTCKNGHTPNIAFQKHKFEILYDVGAYAIIDGYYREAVSSFSAAIERFYEFYLTAISKVRTIDQNEFVASWNIMAKQSERQLGAYIITYLFEHNIKPNILSNDERKFRNDVIHQGKYPTREEALEFGQRVYDLLYPELKYLKTEHKLALGKISIDSLFVALDEAGGPRTTCWFETILGALPGGEDNPKMLSNEIGKMEKGRGGWALRNVKVI